MGKYTRVCCGLRDNGRLVSSEEVANFIKDNEKDYYTSIFQYTDEHLKHFVENKSIAGITDVTTSQLVWDFDSEEDLELAAEETATLAKRLEELTKNPKSVQVYFSGKKGFTVVVQTNLQFTPPQLKELCQRTLGEEFKTLDKSLYNASRILRVPFTKHPSSGLYKIPLSKEQWEHATIDEIKGFAEDLSTVKDIAYEVAVLDASIIPKEAKYKEKNVVTSSYIDYTLKPRWLTNCRWSLQNGNFTQGSRNSALLCLGATYKNQGFTDEVTYRMLKGVAEIESQKMKSDRFSDEEIYNNIIMQIYSNAWKNGQFSCRDKDSWLYDYCKSLGEHSCHNDPANEIAKPRTLSSVNDGFKDFVKNIDKNTILTGIKEIDKHMPITTGMNLGLIGSSGSGKTALALKILNNTSKAGVKTVMASLDMHRNRLFEKVMYRISGLGRNELYKVFQEDKEGKLMEKLKQEYGNVYFYDKSSPTVSDLKDYILACQEDCGEKIKMVMVDYFERVASDFSDDTQASKKVSGELQDLVNDLDIALITLVQPNKMGISGGSNSPIRDYTKIKGSSFLYQSFRGIVSIWRPGYNPEYTKFDKYLQMAILKNDLGELKEFTFAWDGKRGEIETMTDEQRMEYNQFLDLLEADEEEKNDKRGWN